MSVKYVKYNLRNRGYRFEKDSFKKNAFKVKTYVYLRK